MAKPSDNTMRELDDILNESETYADRLTAFLKLKTAAKPPSSAPLFGGFDYSFDFDVDLVKLPPKPQPKDTQKEQPLRETTTNSIAITEPNQGVQELPEEPPTSPAHENVQPRQGSPSKSPRRSLHRSGGVGVPGSDRLRRVAIQRRSRSLGRRDLLREFNDAVSNTSHYTPEIPKDFSNSSSTTLNFLPKTSSTPASAKPASEKQTTITAANASPTTENLPLQEPIEKSMVFTQRRNEVPLISASQRSFAATSQLPLSHNAIAQRTYVVEMGPEPGQLLLSPSDKKQTGNMQQQLSQMSPSRSLYNASLKQSQLRQRLSSQIPNSPRDRQEILAPDTPPRVLSQSQREPEFTVPESQPVPHQETIQHVLQTLTGSPAVTPFVVVPVSCLSPKPKTQVESQPTPTDIVVPVASRSIQTSCSPRFVQNLDQLITDDDSDDQRESSSTPLNLAPPGGNTTRQRRLRKRNQRVKSPNQLLDLHYSRSKDSQRLRSRVTRQTVLNKPLKPPINGEMFAEELARMSNYEILDLRKRSSRGKVHPLNGHRQQQQIFEEHIELEIIRRNLEQPSPKQSKVNMPRSSSLSRSPVRATENETMSNPSFIKSPSAPPVGFRDNSVQEQHSTRRQTSPKPQLQQRRSRLRQRETSRVEKMSMHSSTVISSPAPPPDNFRDSTIQEQRSVHQQKTLRQRRDRSRCREPTMSEDELMAVCTPPPQFRWSKSRQQEQLAVVEHGLTPVAEPPEQFRRSRSTQRKPTEVEEPVVSKQQEQLPIDQPEMSVLPDPPEQFRRSRSMAQEQLAAVDKDVPALLDSRTQSRLSKSMQLKKLRVVVSDVTTLPDPPEQFGQSRSKQQESIQAEKQLAIVESSEAALEDSPPHIRMSRSCQQKTIGLVDPGLTTFSNLSMQHVDAVRTIAEEDEQQERIDIHINNDEAHSKTHIDDQLSMDRVAISASLVDTVLDEQPSTSKAAKQAASKARRKGKEKVAEENAKQDKQALSPVDVFKKPMAPAPRSKRGRMSKELENLRITLPNATVAQDETESVFDSNTTGVRKSKRGQVPLRNTWVHSQIDPFARMRKVFETYLMPAPSKPKKQSGANNTDLLIDRPPLCSSTPRNATAPSNKTNSSGKRKRGQQKKQQERNDPNTIQISGITALSSIAELPEDAQPLEHPIERKTETKKRDRKKKVKVVEDMPPPDIPSKKLQKTGDAAITQECQENPEPMLLPTSPTNDNQHEFESAPLLMNQQRDQSSPLNWLRDIWDQTVSSEACNTEEETDSLLVSRASNMHFSNLNGMDYAFYSGEHNYKMGYMRFKPLQVRGYNRAKRKMQFVALNGQFHIEVNNDGSKENGPLTEKYAMNAGDLLEIKEGACYNITNSLNEVGIFLINRNC